MADGLDNHILIRARVALLVDQGAAFDPRVRQVFEEQ